MSQKKSSRTMATPPKHTSEKPPQPKTGARQVQNCLLIWLDASSGEIDNQDTVNTISKLKAVIDPVKTFTDEGECVNFIKKMKEEKTFIVASGAFGETTVRIVHNMPQVCAIYIFCGNKTHHEQWAKNWPIVKGVFTDIKPICRALQLAVQRCNEDSIPVSFIAMNDDTPNKNLDQLDPSFMYTKILTEILLTINYEPKHIKQFITYCREQFASNKTEMKNIDKFEKEYRPNTAIWWYTYEYFLYPLLDRALRTMDVDMIIKLGFFLCDLHKQIAQLHDEQYGGDTQSDSFTVYRGQSMSQADFDQIAKTKGGLLAFNSFLSANKNRDISLAYASENMGTTELIGVLFVITIDPSKSSTPFADIQKVSCCPKDEQILFSMHSVFRIEQVKQMDGNNRLWHVDLSLTSDRDQDLECLAKRIREETFSQAQGWYRLGLLLIKLGQLDKAQQVYDVLLGTTFDNREQANIYHQLGIVKRNQGKLGDAVTYYEKSMEIMQKTLPPNHPDLAHSYSNFGEVCEEMGLYPKALSYYEKVLDIYQKTLPSSHPSLAASYNNVASVLQIMQNYTKAISVYEKVLEIHQQSLPPTHPDLGMSYQNIATVYYNMTEYTKALPYYEKAHVILQKSYPANHPLLAILHSKIGSVYYKMGDYSKALSFNERAFDIGQQSLSDNHPDVQMYKKYVEDVKEKL
jgi:tetratricopeptide (TPR) repeat protein